MTDPVFRAELGAEQVGDEVLLAGTEGRHAAQVRRIRVGETVLLTDGYGRAVRGPVVAAGKQTISVQVAETWFEEPPPVRFVVAQALAKADRGELAVELLTEVGVSEILPWQAARSITRWTGERGAKGLARWRSTAREAGKQSRRLWTPTVSDPVGLAGLLDRVETAERAVILHEEATTSLAVIDVPAAGEMLLIVGPEGGITPAELDALVAAGAKPALLTPHVLRTSTAGVVACAGLMLR